MTIDTRIRFHCQYSAYSDFFELFAGRGHPLSQSAKPLEFVPHEVGLPTRPMAELRGDEAQELMDALWQVGLRPVQGKQSEGMLTAQGRHLEDMRALAFGKLGIEAPQ